MQPEYLVDRSIGKSVIAAMWDVGMKVHSLASVYGEDVAQKTADEDWIALAGRRGWAALTKDKKIRYKTKERDAVAEHRIHLFALVAGNLTIAGTAAAFMSAAARMSDVVLDEPPGVIWVVYRDGEVARHWPR